MSRVGKSPISLPKGVQFTADKDQLSVKGPKGTLNLNFDPGFRFENENGVLQVVRPSEQKRHKALHGLYRALVNNMVVGVTEGFEMHLELVGVGYRCDAKGQVLELSLGFSHQIFFVCPPEISVTTVSEKGKSPTIILKGLDKQLLGQVAAKIRSIRPPEPYKGKGVHRKGEAVRRKVGKAAGKGKK